MIFLTSCSKDKTFKKENSSTTTATTLRSGPNLDTTWLLNFQTYLKNLRDNVSTSASYTVDEIEYGMETLVNLTYSRFKPGSKTFLGDIDTFNFDPSNNSSYDLFLKVKNSIVDDTSGTTIAAYNLELDTVVNGISQYFASTILSSDDTDLSNSPQDIYLGAGEIHPDRPSTWLECYNKGYGPGSGSGNCGPMFTTALTEIQKKLNATLPLEPLDYYCEDNDSTTEGNFITFYDIDPVPFSIKWQKLYEYLAPTGPYLIPEDGYKSCDCLSDNNIDAVWGALEHFILKEIPIRHGIICINLGTSIHGSMDPPHETVYQFSSELRVGKVLCRYYLNTDVEILDQAVIP